jgi:hypothetical protein
MAETSIDKGRGLMLYLQHVATFAPIDVFVDGSFPFDRETLLELWHRILDELAAIDELKLLVEKQ